MPEGHIAAFLWVQVRQFHPKPRSVDAAAGRAEAVHNHRQRRRHRTSAGMAFESDERALALASCRKAVEERADPLTGTLGR